MKSIITNKFTVAVAALMLTLCSCTSWHYNHPRVKVDANRTQDVAYSKPAENTTASQIQEENVTVPNQENVELTVASTEKTLATDTKVKENKAPVVKTVKAKTKTGKADKFNLFSYTKKLVSESKLLKVKDVEKSAISGWLRLFILFIVIGFILIIIGVILSVVVPGPIWWIFYLFGALLIVAALIILILGLVGIMA